MSVKKSQVKEGMKRINCNIPEYVHEYLASLHGTKKYNAEAMLISAARKNGFRAK